MNVRPKLSSAGSFARRALRALRRYLEAFAPVGRRRDHRIDPPHTPPPQSHAQTRSRNPKGILVIGMHRSGTSAVARVLSLLGVDLPRNVLGPGLGNELGHWEPASAVALHNQMLADAGSATNSPVDFDPAWFEGESAASFEGRVASLVNDEYGSSSFFLMKEPRASLFVPTWLAAFRKLGIEPYFVIPFRHPLEVARSLMERQQTVFPRSVWPAARGVALWLRYMLAAERSTRGHRRSFVSFDALLADWKSEVTRIASQLEITWPREPACAAAEIDQFLGARHRHHSVPDVFALDDLPAPVAAFYQSLLQAVTNPDAHASSFDSAAMDVSAGVELLAPYVARLEAAIGQGHGRINRRVVFVSGAPKSAAHIERVDQHAASARRLGLQVTTLPAHDATARLAEIDGADLVVLWHCPWTQDVRQIVNRSRAANAKVIVDIDDRIFEESHSAPVIRDVLAGGAIEPASERDRFAAIEETITHADLCTASSQSLINALRRFGKPLLRLPNGFSEDACQRAQLGAETRRRRFTGRPRVGYSGSAEELGHDAPALVRLLGTHPDFVLVALGEPISLERFPALAPFADRIEQRGDLPLECLPLEVGSLDVFVTGSMTRQRLAQAIDERRFVYAALARVPTVAMTSGFMAKEIVPGVTGLLAHDEEEWRDSIGALLEDERLRSTIGENALHSILWRYGPEGCDQRLARVFDYLLSGERRAAEAFRAHIDGLRRPAFIRPVTAAHEILLESERKGSSAVAVVISLFNYARYIEEALESVKNQTLAAIDLVVVDDCSTDESASVARRWLEENQARFHHVALLRNVKNSNLGPTRNTGIAFASAPYIMVFDADNILMPACLERCLAALVSTDAGGAFPMLRQFGNSQNLMGVRPWQQAQLACANYIDAMAMIRKSAWAACGGYANDFFSREDYEMWMKFVELGLWATHVPETLALYRVHDASMIHRHTPERISENGLWPGLERAHPWIAIPD